MCAGRTRDPDSPVPITLKADFLARPADGLRRGEYDVLHCHHDILSAVYLLAATGMSIRRRIVHVHNADEAVLSPPALVQAAPLPRTDAASLSLFRLIVSSESLTIHSILFCPGRARRPERDAVHYYGLDPTLFKNVAADRAAFRRQRRIAQGRDSRSGRGGTIFDHNLSLGERTLSS